MEFINNLKSFCQRLFFMVQKELLTTLKDKRMRVMMIVPALTQGFLFGYAASYNLDEVPYAVVDMDHSEESRQLLAHFQGNKSFQLVVTPLSPVEILLGKAVVPMLVGVVQSTMLFLIARFWFEIPFAGSVVDLYILLLIFMLSLTGAGLMISAVSATMQQVMVYLMVLMMPMVLLSGIATPINNMPEILQLCTWADPLRFAVDGVRRIYLEGAALGDLSENIAALLAIAGITLPGAGWLFYNRSV